jgi:lipopolysaccharide export system permease protein
MKPAILDLYIARKFFVTLLLFLGITSILSVVFDISEKMDDFLGHHVPLHAIVFDYYVNFVPTIVNIVSPIMIFLSVLFFTAKMADNSEILSILSSGVSYNRLLAPYLVLAILVAAADYGMKNYIVPRAYSKVVNFQMQYTPNGYNYDARNIHRQLDRNTYFYAQNVDYNSGRAYRFSIEKFDGQKLTYKLRALDAWYDSTSSTWVAHNYVARTINGLHESLSRGDSLRMKIPLTIADFGEKVKSMPSMTTPELKKFIKSERFKGESLLSFYYVEKDKRTSMPFAIIILIVIAVAVSTRKIRGGIGTHLLIGILIAISFELFMRFSTTFATNSNLSPFLSVWIPNVIYLAVALGLLKYTPK